MTILHFSKVDVEKVLADLPAAAEIMLVGDQGVYLMSFASTPDGRPLAFAHGMNPEKDKEWYATKRAIFGGDDGGDFIGTAGEMRKILATVKNILVIHLTETHIEVTYGNAGNARAGNAQRPNGK